ncbi:MAG: flippase-like domain-containing protein [Acidimicrobiales bacterium]|nr:flippase-like domain-containing protein [Acidimicrobiales bacterium]HRW38037.1 lysylphosphatidylglycerol synthase transmembrane domain-containing protein [Aquihabitans sp.]
MDAAAARDVGDDRPSASAQPRVVWVRHPADVARLILAVGVWLLVYGYGLVYPEDARSLSARLVLAFDGLPPTVARTTIGLVQVAALAAPLLAMLVARRGRWREIGLAVGAAAVTGVLGAVLDRGLVDAVPAVVLDEAERPSWVSGSAFPSGAYLAAVVAAATVLAPTFPRPWRRALWSAVGVVAAARVMTAVETPVGIVSSLAAGAFVGSAVMVVAKAPLRWPAADAVAAAIGRAGRRATAVAPTAVRHRHGPTYDVVLADGAEGFAKVVGRDERDAELLSRAVRALRVADPGDRSSPGATQVIEHEALACERAARAGARVPAVLAVSSTDERAAVLLLERLAGTTAADADVARLTDDVLVAAFDQLARLRAARLAHGWLSLDHVWLADDGDVGLIDLRWTTLAATDRQLDNDLADLLVSVALAVGVERAVAAARQHVDGAALGSVLPLLQPLAVAPETRAALRGRKELLGELRTAVQEAAGVDAYEMAKLERLTVRKVIVFVATLVLAQLLLSMLANAGEIWDAVQDANPAYIPILLVLPLLTYPAGAASLLGAVTGRLPFLRTTQVMFAQSFLNRFTPANAGGMALRARYLQRNGVPLVNAASSVAITSAASGVAQVVLGVTFFAWAGRAAAQDQDTGSGFSMPSGQVIAIVVVVVLAALGALLATRFGRKLWNDLKVNVTSVWADVRNLAGRPSKLALLFGGATAAKLFTIICFAQTMRAFGQPVDFAVVGVVYLTANTVASAAPTPGGVGAIEAALTAGLVGLGIEAGEAAAIVLVFRLFSYWLPILPCWASLAALQRSGEV